jgi:hypothetical protein
LITISVKIPTARQFLHEVGQFDPIFFQRINPGKKSDYWVKFFYRKPIYALVAKELG